MFSVGQTVHVAVEIDGGRYMSCPYRISEIRGQMLDLVSSSGDKRLLSLYTRKVSLTQEESFAVCAALNGAL